MPTLTKETGASVAGANTYIDLTDYAAYLSDRGLTDSRTDSQKEAAIIAAKDWIESKEPKFSGYKVDADNPLVWPRYYAMKHGYYIESDTIPQELKDAQAQLAYDSASYSLFTVGDGREVVREKVDVIEVEYSRSGRTTIQSVFNKVEAFLKPLYKNGGVFGTIRV